ncbi:anti-sigma factor [Candidatus Thiothrix anitrata]|jgi:hypothetical protein|uniref:Anti-sigma factor n=1 Tax=Candidatus Thiothrix anitrata TaxID=2823902 RepID=A0ABX7X431_9GAMM|nr:hypothetical protein [Candidatus Thiothrix anitrata]QTR50634.1 hypothetical protein J8380_03430 [Candidatus Thiothrix anitrata]
MSLFPQGDPVEEARLLLPWYITGKLGDAERELVERMLAQHPSLQAEYRNELNMVGLIRDNASLLQLSTVDSTTQRLDKLMKRIERETQHVAPPVVSVESAHHQPSVKPKPSWADFLRKLIPDATWFTPANTVFASLLVIQIGLLGWYSNSLTVNPETIYVSASVSETPATVAVTQGMTLLVSFRDEAQIRQLRQFLHQWNAHIIDGPDNNDLFRLQIRDVPATDQRSEVILEQMQQDQNVIAFIGREF